MKAFELVPNPLLACRPLKRRPRSLPIKYHHSHCWFKDAQRIEEPDLDVAKLGLVGMFFEHSTLEPILLLSVEGRSLNLATWVRFGAVGIIVVIAVNLEVVLGACREINRVYSRLA